MKGASNAKRIRKVLHGAAKIGSLFEPTQKQFFQAYAPDGVRFRDLKPLGPITILKLKFRPSDYDRRIVAELWFFPDGSRILELSTKTAPKDMFSVGAEVRRRMFQDVAPDPVVVVADVRGESAEPIDGLPTGSEAAPLSGVTVAMPEPSSLILVGLAALVAWLGDPRRRRLPRP